MDFNVADTVSRDIKVLVTKTRYTLYMYVCMYVTPCEICIFKYLKKDGYIDSSLS